MAIKLVRVAKTQPIETFLRDANIRVRHPQAINPREVRDNGLDGEGSYNACEFFEVDEIDVEATVLVLTAQNPGKEVRVYDLIQVSERPAGDMVTKKVTKEGVLPV